MRVLNRPPSVRIVSNRTLWLLLALALLTVPQTAHSGGTDPATIPLDAHSAQVHTIAIAMPRMELYVPSGGRNLARAPDAAQLRGALNLIKSLVQNMPGGARVISPLPHEMGEDVTKSICHRDSYLSLARLLEESYKNRNALRDVDPLRHVLAENDPVCEFPAYQEADAILVSHLHGTEGEWAGNVASILGAAAITAASMGRVIATPGPGAQGLTLRVVLVDARTHRLLATSQETSTLSASEENLDEMLGETIECLQRFDRMPQKELARHSGYGCRAMRPYHFGYENKP